MRPHRPIDAAPRLPGSLLWLVALGACGDGADAPGASPGDQASAVRFVDVAEESGIDFRHEDGRSADFYTVEYMTAGGALFDAEGDGDLDLYLLNGERLVPPPLDPPALDRLYVNDGTGRFADGTAGSGLGDPLYSEGVCVADVDNDGDEDVYVTDFDAPNPLYQNDGTGRFTDVAHAAGVEGGPCMDSSCAFADVDNDGAVDLFVCYYLDHSRTNNLECLWPLRDGSGKARRYCPPERYKPLPSLLYRSRGDGTFEDVSITSGIAASTGRALGVAFADYDDDGDQDIFVSCDRSQNLFFENQGGCRFQERAMMSGVGLSGSGAKQAGMGITSADFDGDERLDVAVTYFEEEWNGFYRNLGHNLFADVAEQNGTSRPSYNLLAWGIQFFDADLDGDLDCFVANGHIMDNVALFREPVAGFAQPNLFYRNRGRGQFESLGTDAGPALALERVSRGLATGDVDNDGDVDLLVCNLRDRPELLRNDSPREGRHWLSLRLVGTKSNRDGIGARVIAHLPDRNLVREVHSGQSYLSQSDLRVHLGLGSLAVLPRLEVRWPSGARSELEQVEADRFLELVEP